MSALGKLGFAADEKVVVIHVDDIGMSPAANRGALRALEGAATCGSIMVPCPAFDEIAQIACERPELDLGVHLTLNCEYESYRWGPLRDDVPGLCAPDGGMWRTRAESVEHASPEEVDRELRAQIDRALEAGIDVTHFDSHMGTVMELKFAEVYMNLAFDYNIPALVPRVTQQMLDMRGIIEGLGHYLELIELAESKGFPVFDQLDAWSLHFEPGNGLEHNRARLESLGPGLAFLIVHCAEGGDELAGISPNDWRLRDEEHQIYSDGRIAAVVEELNLRPIGMRPLRDLL